MQAIRTGKPVVEMSVQQVVDCSTNDGNHGCDGGDTCTALDWMVRNHIDLETAGDYPIEEGSGSCRAKKSSSPLVVANYTCDDFVSDELQIVNLLATHGPLAVAVDATSWQDYLGGVIQFHCDANRNHAVQVCPRLLLHSIF